MSNKKICKLVDKYIDNFFDNVNIELNEFKNNNWKIKQTISSNKRNLFYDKKFLTLNDELFFNQLYDKYITFISEILSRDNILIKYLIAINDRNIPQHHSSILSIINNPKYDIISPLYIIQLCMNISTHKKDIMNELDSIIRKKDCIMHNFNEIYEILLTTYVTFEPFDPILSNKFYIGFINSLLIVVYKTIMELIDLHIYSVNDLFSDVLNTYTPLCEILNNNDNSQYM
jgi:hypothetical protein